MRYYQHSMGTITVDGIPVDDLNVEWLRSMIGIVSQEPVLFHTTIAENLRMGRSNVTQDEMEEACRDANAHEFIIKFPNGYESKIGEGGVRLSGGQKVCPICLIKESDFGGENLNESLTKIF